MPKMNLDTFVSRLRAVQMPGAYVAWKEAARFCHTAANVIEGLRRERAEARAERDHCGLGWDEVRAGWIEQAKEWRAENDRLRRALLVISEWTEDAHRYDEECDHEPRDRDEEMVEAIEEFARAALAKAKADNKSSTPNHQEELNAHLEVICEDFAEDLEALAKEVDSNLSPHVPIDVIEMLSRERDETRAKAHRYLHQYNSEKRNNTALRAEIERLREEVKELRERDAERKAVIDGALCAKIERLAEVVERLQRERDEAVALCDGLRDSGTKERDRLKATTTALRAEHSRDDLEVALKKVDDLFFVAPELLAVHINEIKGLVRRAHARLASLTEDEEE